MHETTTAPPLAWSRAFPAAPMQIREARRFLADLLNGHPATEDAVLCLSELATNATLHSNSAQPGGQFTVLAGLDSDHLRVEVQDEDGPWTRPAPGDERGHGLSIVSQLARVWGVSGDCHTGWTVWALSGDQRIPHVFK